MQYITNEEIFWGLKKIKLTFAVLLNGGDNATVKYVANYNT